MDNISDLIDVFHILSGVWWGGYMIVQLSELIKLYIQNVWLQLKKLLKENNN